jgi:hypothetical protein
MKTPAGTGIQRRTATNEPRFLPDETLRRAPAALLR